MAEEKERLGQQAARCRREARASGQPAPRANPGADISPACRQRAELEELRLRLEESCSAESRALRAEFEKGREGQEQQHQVCQARPALLPGGPQGGL